MPGKMEFLRVPIGLCLAALLCFGVSLWRLSAPSGEVAEATSTIGQDGCRFVPWVRWIGFCRGIVLLELAPDANSAGKVVKAISDARATEAAETSIRLDYFLIPSYVALLGFLGATAARLAELLGFTRLIPWLFLVVGLQLVAGVLDGVENVGLFSMLLGRDIPGLPGGVPAWTFWASTVKWCLVTAGLLVPAVALLAMSLLDRRRRSRSRGQPAPAAA